jgi:hypothetical protein
MDMHAIAVMMTIPRWRVGLTGDALLFAYECTTRCVILGCQTYVNVILPLFANLLGTFAAWLGYRPHCGVCSHACIARV